MPAHPATVPQCHVLENKPRSSDQTPAPPNPPASSPPLPCPSHPEVDQEVAEVLLPLLPRAAQQLLQEMGPNGSSNQPLVHIGALVLGNTGQGQLRCRHIPRVCRACLLLLLRAMRLHWGLSL